MIVHILRHGQPLCGFSEDIPAHWPEGHAWVGDEDGAEATCSGCKSQADDTQKV